MVEVRMDFEVANLRACEMAAVAAVMFVASESVAIWYVLSPMVLPFTVAAPGEATPVELMTVPSL